MTAADPQAPWEIGYDIFDPSYVHDPYPLWADLRERCPVAHTEAHKGSWLPTRYEDVVAIAHDVDTFSSREILVVPRQPVPDMPYAEVQAPPITSDPPEHHWARRLILPIFSPQSVAKYEPGCRELCSSLIDGFVDAGSADAAADYAQQIPVRVIAAMLGVGTERSDEFVSWVRGVLEQGLTDPVVRLASRNKIIEFFLEQIADRRANPREDDLITTLLHTEIDGQPLSDTHILGTCNLMLVAGIDTTWSAIGSSLWHLAQHPDQQAALRERPELWPTAIEELLRAYSPVTMARMAAADAEVGGCPIKAGDRVLLNFPGANRDPRMFEAPDEVRLDRELNRHVAFGSGIHRCAGSNLARLELRVALQTWLERIPSFELEDPSSVTWSGGQVRGPRSCRVRFPARVFDQG